MKNNKARAVRCEELVRQTGEWLRGTGPSSEVVMSSRVRLARNLSDVPFVMSMSEADQRMVVESVGAALGAARTGSELSYLALHEMDELDRQVLVERHLVSREFGEREGPRAAAVHPDETISIMVNEEDHLRLQAMKSGLQLDAAWETLDAIDTELSARLPLAFDAELGFLTACPTNVGTGLRASVMLHLPALVMSNHVEKAFRAISKLNLAVRGFYGEGTDALGDFYQISNQITLGRSELEILEDLKAVIDQIVSYENKAREGMLTRDRMRLEDRVWRSYGALSMARVISSDEVMQHLSAVRLGVHMELLKGVDLATVNRVFILSQPAHLQKYEKESMDPDVRDVIRATMVRKLLASAKAE